MSLSLSVLRRRQSRSLDPSFSVNFLSGTLDPQITFTRSTTATRVNSQGLVESVAINGPRFDYDPVTLAPRGLLVEEQRTNGIRNNTAQGAVAGTPGTLPTYWDITTSTINGITRTVIGTGVENGITYVDIKYSGTAVGAGNISITSEYSNQVAAAQNQVWTFSCYARLAAGSFANTAARILYVNSYTAGGGFDANAASTTTNFPVNGPTTAPLSLQRYFFTGTLASATTVFVNAGFYFTYNAGAVIDFTLRVGLPQLELGAFATSVIPTTTTALTRAADVASVTGTNFASWYNATEGTTYVEASTLPSVTVGALTHAISDGTFNQSIYGNFANGNLYVGANVLVGGVGQASNIGSFSITTSTNITKDAFAYKQDNFGESCNGATPRTDLTGTIPTVNRLYIGSNWAGAGNFLNGYIRAFGYYPTRLPNDVLQRLTT